MRRRVVLLMALVALLWAMFGASLTNAADPDETRQGGTTGAAFVQNKYIWTGDTSRYGEVGVRFHIDVIKGTLVYFRWECRGKNGPTDSIGTFPFDDVSRDVSYPTFQGAQVKLTDLDTYCAYHVWAVSGPGFRITTASVEFWRQEFIGGGPSNPTPPPGATTGPGTQASPTPTPTPTATPSPSPSGGPGGNYWYCTVASGGTADCFDASHFLHVYVGDVYTVLYEWNVIYNASYNPSITAKRCVTATNCTTTDLQGTTAGVGPTNALHTTGGPASGSETKSLTLAAEGYVWMNANGTRRGTSDTTGTWYRMTFTLVTPGPTNPLYGASPTPTASPSPTPNPSCAPGTVWTGTGCEFPPPGGGGGAVCGGGTCTTPPPWYGSPPPPLVTPTPGPNLGGSGGLDDGEHSPMNNNGLAACTSDDGTYSKPGQAPERPLNDTSFPGSINPLDYIPWVGNMVSNVPIVVSNAGQWMVNTGVDFVVPGPCVSTLIEDGRDALMEKAPFSLFTDAQAAVEASVGGAGSGAAPSMVYAGTTVTVPLASIAADVAPFRGFMGAAVWLLGIIGVLRLIAGTAGVSNGGAE